MQGVEGEILEDELHLRIVGQEAGKSVVKIAADGAFEVGELDNGYGGFRVAEDRGFGQIELGGVFRQGIFGEVGEIAPEEVPAVPGHIHFHLVGALVGFDVNVGFEEAGVPYFRGRGYGDLDVGTKSECAAEVGFNTFLERGLRRGSGLLRVRDGRQEDCEQEKCDWAEFVFHAMVVLLFEVEVLRTSLSDVLRMATFSVSFQDEISLCHIRKAPASEGGPYKNCHFTGQNAGRWEMGGRSRTRAT